MAENLRRGKFRSLLLQVRGALFSSNMFRCFFSPIQQPHFLHRDKNIISITLCLLPQPFKLRLYSVLTCLGKRWTMSVRLNEAPTSYHFFAFPSSWNGRGGQFILSPPKAFPYVWCKAPGRQAGDSRVLQRLRL